MKYFIIITQKTVKGFQFGDLTHCHIIFNKLIKKRCSKEEAVGAFPSLLISMWWEWLQLQFQFHASF